MVIFALRVFATPPALAARPADNLARRIVLPCLGSGSTLVRRYNTIGSLDKAARFIHSSMPPGLLSVEISVYHHLGDAWQYIAAAQRCPCVCMLRRQRTMTLKLRGALAGSR